jgi:hypothetical protein
LTGGLSHAKTGFRFKRGEEIVDVLGPDGTKTAPQTTSNFETIQVKGGTQALQRSELVSVELDGNTTTVRTPTLTGAILLKARAIRSTLRDQDREDLIVLLACVADPRAIRNELTNTERNWLQRAERRLDLANPDLTTRFTAEQLARVRATYQLLTQ